MLYFFDDKCFKIGLEVFFREGKGRVANFGLIELESLKTLEGLAEGIDGLLAEEDTVFAVNNVIKSAAVAVGDDWAAAGESFDGGNAKRFERGEDVAFGLFEIFFEALLVLKRSELDVARFLASLTRFLCSGPSPMTVSGSLRSMQALTARSRRFQVTWREVVTKP